MNITSTFRTYLANLKHYWIKVMLALSAMTIIIAAAYFLWLFLSESIKYKISHRYTRQLVNLNSADNKLQRMEDLFVGTSYPLYKFFWGLKILDHFRQNGDLSQEKDLLTDLIAINGIPRYFKDILRIELSNVLLQLNYTSSDIIEILNSIEQGSLWQPSALEIKANLALRDKDMKLYNELNEKLLKTADNNLSKRAEENSYIINNSLHIRNQNPQ